MGFTPITSPQQLRDELGEDTLLRHYASAEAWEIIKYEGLSQMKRDHIHFSAVTAPVPRKAKVLIYVNAIDMLEQGMALWKAANGVWLTSGWEGRVDASFIVRHEVIEK